ncbi:Protein of unknown function [Lactobacillus pasteurii DSM 23907 = CRBIP 24.76]|uniref:Uncharacterized protein n=1 Tax=Lactobacillus pasteurii DSM 23907 = CRBIP 24.76 TaxID=1423790 RepID=I7KKP2_9LACO|nr:Protein of unknown function [Lactobacillus pasteurii DSM 23907 = CRBIP 24.76]
MNSIMYIRSWSTPVNYLVMDCVFSVICSFVGVSSLYSKLAENLL